MDPITVQANIALPREQIFEYLSDIAHHAEFTDHYLYDWHLLREETYGAGAGARFRVKAPLNRFAWADMTLSELTAPYRIVTRGRGGKFNRIRMMGVWEINYGSSPAASKVTYTFETDVSLPSDKIRDTLGGRTVTRRQLKKAMRRLRTILEDDRDRGARPTVAAR